MKIVIIGNGVAGTFTAQYLRNLDTEADIEIYSSETHSYYTRVKLPEVISEKISIEDLIVFKEDWYDKNQIKQFLDKTITSIHLENKDISIDGFKNPVSYDKLVIATGSLPNIPPIKNASNMVGKGVYTLRNIKDAQSIKRFIDQEDVKNALIIGGGLLGLELANQIKNCGLNTTVVEFFPRLLPRQLDVDCGGLLKDKIESMGIKVVLNASTEEVLIEEDRVKGVRLNGGDFLKAELVLIQAGITPTINLARNSGLEVNRGIIVNDLLETSAKDVYAVGDCIEFKGQIWGIIPACIDQAKIVANSIVGKHSIKYNGTVPKNTLKIMGIDLTSIGIFDLEDKDTIGAGWQILKGMDSKEKCYKKIVLKDNNLKGAILFGENEAISYVTKNIEKSINEAELRKAINLYKWICLSCGAVYDEAIMEVLFKDLPEDWTCPECNAPKKNYKKERFE
ncbi:MAG: FAD-dependent oxidoreductase [Candidatus Lokiarchaeota archaeon]|nr:FAD-dependent oxidoreductase [Candidatus Lokiarchaeota archaeon]